MKNKNSTGVDAVNAKPIAVPRNGAEHGVLKSTRSAPVKNAPQKPCLRPALSILVVALPGSQISKTPKKLMAKALRITTMNAMNPALWNCMPQPAFPPPALTAATIPASAQKLARIPSVVDVPSTSSRLRLSRDCLIRLKSFSESTGSTHGIKFRIKPPNSAERSRMNVPVAPSAAFPAALFSTFEVAEGDDSFASLVALAAAFSVAFPAPSREARLVVKPSGPSPNVTCDGARQMELSHAW